MNKDKKGKKKSNTSATAWGDIITPVNINRGGRNKEENTINNIEETPTIEDSSASFVEEDSSIVDGIIDFIKNIELPDIDLPDIDF